MATSGTYNFQTLQIELLIREAFERIGIVGELIEPQKLEAAKRTIDFLLIEWMNESINLWTIQLNYLPLVTAQGKYILSNTVNDILQINLRTSTRQLNGVAASSSGIAANAFDNNSATACTQNAINGNISYDYGAGVTQQINFVGIQSNATLTYTLILESSQDNATWVPLYTIPAQTFNVGNTVWFDVLAPVNARAYRIRETGGVTLNIQEIYFNNNTLDMLMANVSREEFFSQSNQKLQSRPNLFYLDSQVIPVLYIWPVPTDQYNVLQYSSTQMIQDAGSLYTNSLQIPARFYPALVWGLSYHLALKYSPQSAQLFQSEYEKSLRIAQIEDSETVPLRIYTDYNKGYY